MMEYPGQSRRGVEIDLEDFWDEVTVIFPILQQSQLNVAIPFNYVTFEQIVAKLAQLDIAENIYEIVMYEIDENIRIKTAPNFWGFFKGPVDNRMDNFFDKFESAVKHLFDQHKKYIELLKRVQHIKRVSRVEKYEERKQYIEDEIKVFDTTFVSMLLSQMPANFNDAVYAYYSRSFKIFMNKHHREDDEDLRDIRDIKCNGCERQTDICRCSEMVESFNITNELLNEMNLLDRISGFALTSLLQERISAYVQDTCTGIFDKSHLSHLEEWMDLIVFDWLTRIHNAGVKDFDKKDVRNKRILTIISDFKVKISYYLCETYAKSLIDQFFSIIIDYPDSMAAIHDLKQCLEKIELRQHLVKTLKKSLEVRLLHPGVNTMDILTGYVAAIKAIRQLDSSGVLVESVTEPVKDYLRRRNDTVRRVVTGLTEEGPTDLADELARSETMKKNIGGNGKDDMTNWELWEPDPVDATPSVTRTTRSADIISMVVDIYGSKELFVSEYRGLLADRLLTQLDFKPEKEIRNLELLKVRFGEGILHNCEVMLKDISDSKRINAHIHSDLNYSNNKAFDISSLILSAQYWPTFNKETLELPEEIQEEFKKYTKSYEAYKGNRTLSWRHVTGRMNIEIELKNRTLEMAVNPTQAVIIYHFQNKNTWTLDELSALMKVPSTVLRKKINFWITQGLIKQTQVDTYTLIDEGEEPSIGEITQKDIVVEDDENESVITSASEQREEELQVFWSYIVGMLTNLDSLPIERIHQMLKMFASHGPGIEFSQEELRNFLQRKVREHKLIFAGGVYQLAK